jgi:hypothetical protein
LAKLHSQCAPRQSEGFLASKGRSPYADIRATI